MRKKSSIMVIILFVSISACQKQNINNTVDFKYVSGVLIVNGKVGESIHGMFQIDTGANNSFIRKIIADKLNIIPSGKVKGPGPGGKTLEIPTAKVKSISIGNHSTSLSSCAIIDMKNQQVPETFLGLIGSDFLKNFVVTIDYKKKVLVFEDNPSLNARLISGIKIPIKFNITAPNLPYLSAVVNDSIKDEYLFDTGVPITHLSYTDFQALGLTNDMQNMETKSKNILGSKFESYYTNIASFALNDSLRIENLKIGTYENCNGLIGNNFLSNFIITLNYKGKYILFNKI
jgi:hypothetical protein